MRRDELLNGVLYFAIVIFGSMAIVGATLNACAPKPTTPSGTTDPLASSAKAADDIALSIKLLVETERNLEQQKLITPQEGLVIINGLTALHAADVGFVSDIRNVQAGHGTIKDVLIPALGRLSQAVNDLNASGVLGIKNAQAKATFQTALNTVNVAIATIQTVLTLKQ